MVLHFKSKLKFKKWNAYRFIHHIPTKHNQVVILGSRHHKVKHKR